MAGNSRETGTVKWFSEDKGYGFIKREAGPDVFAHRSEIQGADELVEGQGVEFGIERTPRGLKAVQITILQPVEEDASHLTVVLMHDVPEEVGKLAAECFWTKSRSAGTLKTTRDIGERYAADQPPWPSVCVYQYGSRTGRSRSETHIRRNSGIPGLIAGANTKRFFWGSVLAIEYESLDSDSVTVIVKPDHVGRCIGRGGTRIKFVQESLGLRRIDVREVDDWYVKSRLTSNEAKMRWQVQARGFMAWRGVEYSLGSWTDIGRWQSAIGLPSRPELPVCSLDRRVLSKDGIQRGLRVYDEGVLTPDGPYFAELDLDWMLQFGHDAEIAQVIYDYVVQHVVGVWPNGGEMRAKFDEMLPELLQSASLPHVKKKWFRAEDGAPMVKLSDGQIVEDPEIMEVVAREQHGFYGQGWWINITVGLPGVHGGQAKLEIRYDRSSDKFELGELVRQRHWEYTSQHQRELEQAEAAEAARQAYELEHARDPHEVHKIYGSFAVKDGWTGGTKEKHGPIGELRVWFDEEGMVGRMEFAPIVDLELNPQYAAGEARLVIDEESEPWMKGKIRYKIADRSDCYNTSITVVVGIQEFRVRIGGRDQGSRLLDAVSKQESQLNAHWR